MSKYADAEDALYSIFDSDAWKAEGVATYPANFTPQNINGDFIKIAILSATTEENVFSAKGMMIIDIYTSAGIGTRPANIIADKLDKYFLNSSVSSVLLDYKLQLFGSSLSHKGTDKDNPSLHRSSYVIHFKFFKGSK